MEAPKKSGNSVWYLVLAGLILGGLWYWFIYLPQVAVQNNNSNENPPPLNRPTPQIVNSENIAPITAFGLLSRLRGGENVNIPQQGNNNNISQVNAGNLNPGSLLN